MNKQMLRRLAKRMGALRKEETYNQGVYAVKSACGTEACLAGHAVMMVDHRLPSDDLGYDWERIRRRATAILDLTPVEAARLFGGTGTNWPRPFAARFRNARHALAERESRVAAEMLSALARGEVRL